MKGDFIGYACRVSRIKSVAISSARAAIVSRHPVAFYEIDELYEDRYGNWTCCYFAYEKIGTISGTVIDAVTRDPIKDAYVTLGDYSTQTLADGTYFLWGFPPGSDHVMSSATGYVTDSVFLMHAGEDHTIDFELVKEGEPPTDLEKLWADYFANPDVVKFMGLLPSATQESFSLVFTEYSLIHHKPAMPEIGDHISVWLIIGGLIGAAVATVIGLVPLIKGLTILAALKTKLLGAKQIIDLGYIEPGATAIEGSIKAALAAKYGIGFGILATMKAEFLAHPLFSLLAMSFTVAQLDVIGWGLGLLPEGIHRRAETLSKAIRGDLIRLEQLVRAKEWDAAKTLADQIDVELYQARLNLEGAPATFWEKFGFSLDDARAMFDALEISLNSYRAQYPMIGPALPKFPADFFLEDVEVVDGDTIIFPDHPEVKSAIRFLGIDTHEIETRAGKVEAEYLEGLISGKTVLIKTHEYRDPERTFDSIGRLLAGVFLEDKDIALEMLRKFGKEILTPKKYWKKYRWIDWDEYKREAEKAVPTIAKVKVYSSPAYARLFIDGVATRKITIETFELDVGKTYHITAEKTGYVGFTHTVTVPPDGAEIRIELKKKGTTAQVKVYSSPAYAMLYIDGVATRKITIETFELDLGKEFEITAKKAGYKDASKTITVPLGGMEIRLELEEIEVEVPPDVVPPEVPPEVPPVEEFSIKILSTPSRAKLYIDDVYLHHLTPSDEVELSRGPYYGIEKFTPGPHVIKAELAGKRAVKTVDILPGYNEPIYLVLEVVGLVRTEAEITAEIAGLEARAAELRKELEALK